MNGNRGGLFVMAKQQKDRYSEEETRRRVERAFT
jgi:hypothetical protein